MWEYLLAFDGVRIQIGVCSHEGSTPPNPIECPRSDLYQSDDRGASFRWLAKKSSSGYPPGIEVDSGWLPGQVAGEWDKDGSRFIRSSDGRIIDLSPWRTAERTILFSAIEHEGRLALTWEDGTFSAEKRRRYLMVIDGSRITSWWIGGPFEYEVHRFSPWGWINDHQVLGSLELPAARSSAALVKPVNVPAIFDVDQGWVAPIEGVADAFGSPRPGSLPLGGAFPPQ